MTEPEAMIPDTPLAERVKWLRAKGISAFFVGTLQQDNSMLGAITFRCNDCPEEHVLETFPSEAEAEVALELAFHDSGSKVEDAKEAGRA